MPDVPLNPKTPLANLTVPVTAAAPMPVVSGAAPPADNGKVINPVTWVVSGADVSDANPMPLTVV